MSNTFKHVAIIGHACRFPGGSVNPEKFWELLLQGTDAVTAVPAERFDQKRFLHPDPAQAGKSYTFAAGTIGDVASFDADFFGISAREAAQMDPQQRLLLELTWEAFERAGQIPSRLAGSNCAVYVGISGSDYAERRMGDLETSEAYFMLGATLSIAANRISYIFDLRGPSLAIDTACSSSLVALHEAVHAIQGGRAGMAVVGGVNLLLSPAPFVGFAKASMLSPNGRCRAFDKNADGYVRAEGGGVLILKPLADAHRDKDPVLAVIRGVGVNTDGRTHGIAMPSSEMQEALLRRVYRDAHVSPRSVSYFEAHGTGTSVGDPIEASAIGRAIGVRRPKSQPLLVGSVKSNIGHLEPAAGIAGIIKGIEILRNRVVPRSLHIEEPNPEIPFEALNLQPAQEATPLPQAGEHAIVGINSFGFGGTNAHVILESAEEPHPVAERAGGRLPFVLSGRTAAALNQAVRDARDALAKPLNWRDVAYTATCRRSHHEHRLIVRADDLEGARRQLEAFQAGTLREGQSGSVLQRGAKTALVFVGNGVQWSGMGVRLLQEDEVFRDAIAQLDSIARWRLGWSVMQQLSNPATRMDDTRVAQPLLFAVQVGLVQSLRARGIQFGAVVGHSVGEVAAAYASGALSLEQAVQVIRERSEAQGRTKGHGRMLAVSLGEDAVAEEIAPFAGAVEIAASNSPRAVTLSGPGDALLALEEGFKARDINCRLLDLDYAFHSAAQDPTEEHVLRSLANLTPFETSVDFYSSVYGAKCEGSQLNNEYWWHNVRNRVRFSEAISALAADGFQIFVEVGPHPLLQGYMRHIFTAGKYQAQPIATVSRNDDGATALERAIDRAFVLGTDVEFERHFQNGGNVVTLPTYPWQRERHWYQPTTEAGNSFITRTESELLGLRLAPNLNVWEKQFDTGTVPLIADHVVGGTVVVPAACYAEMALEAGRSVFGDGPIEIEGLEIQRPIALDQGQSRMVRFSLSAEAGHFTIESRERMRGSAWSQNVVGRLSKPTHISEPHLPAAPGPDAVEIAGEDHYAFATARGFAYGPAFAVLRAATADRYAAHADLALDEADDKRSYRLHPALIDGALQTIFTVLRRHQVDGTDAYVPQKIGRLLFQPGGQGPYKAEVSLVRAGRRSIVAHCVLRDGSGAAIAELRDVRLVRVPVRSPGMPAPSLFETAVEPLVSLQAATMSPAPFQDARRALVASLEEYPQKDACEALNALAVAFAADALIELGGEATVPADRQALLARLIDIVENAAPDVSDSIELWRETLRRHPELIAELTLLGRAGRSLANVLRGTVMPPTPSPAVLDHLYDSAPVCGRGNQTLAAAVEAFGKAWPAHRRLRVLELGSGNGAFSRLLLLALPPGRSDVTLTDPDEALLAALAARYAGNCDVHTAQFDLTSTAHLEPFAYDLIVGAFCLHGTDRGAVLRAVSQVAAPGAALVLADFAASPWTDLVFGPDAPDHRAITGPAIAAGFHAAESHAHGGIEVLCATASPTQHNEAQHRDALWLIVAGPAEAELAELLASKLAMRGQITSTVNLADATGDADSWCERWHSLGGRGAPPAGIIHLAGLMENAERTGDVLALQQRRCDALLAAVHGVMRADRAARPEIVAVTRAALPLRGDATLPGQAPLAGLIRVLQNEIAEMRCRIIDLHGDPSILAGDLAVEILFSPDENEVMLAEEGRFAPRPRKLAPVEPALAEDSFESLQSPGGSLDNLRWVRAPRRALAPDEIEIEVKAAGLNFRDVMFAMGALPDDILEGGFAGANLGMESAGIVSRVGDGVDDVKPGDMVVCFAPACFASHVVTRRFAIAPLPAHMSFAEGATLVTAFFTVTYALKHVARLMPGERILIHGGAGAVGMAAIQYALACGAEVFATAGNDEKRDLVKLFGIPDDHVLDSRSTAFADRIREVTGNEGIDVVLNSVAGEAVFRGLSVLRPFGRFIELGKADFVANSRIGLRTFRNNIAYFGVDADQLMSDKPQLAGTVFREMMDLFAAGTYSPLPYRLFPRERVVDAFRLMQRSHHVGKIVIDPTPPARVEMPARRPVTIDAGAAYLVTGGVAGLGLATAEWLAGCGARHLVLVSRRGEIAAEDAARVEALKAAGVTVDVRGCNVADEDAVNALIAEFAATPLRGIVHAAAVYDDALIADMTPERFQTVLAPKAGGAWALHRATKHVELDFFLMYSSISATIGNPGQSNYVAANLFLESLAAHRRAIGLTAHAIALAPISDAGYLTRHSELAANFAKMGMRPLDTAELFARLDEIVLGGAPGSLIADVKWGKLRGLLPALRAPKFRALLAGSGEQEDISGETDFTALAAALDPDELLQLLLSTVTDAVAQILHIPAERLDKDRSVFDLGMDSLMGLELRMSIEEKFGVEISPMMLSQDVGVRRIAEIICDQLLGNAPAPAKTASEPDAAQAEQTQILAKHAEKFDAALIEDAMAAVKQQPRTRLIP